VPLSKRQKLFLVIWLCAAVIIICIVTLKRHCPSVGLAFTKARRDFHRLKNRTALPQANDFDARVTLASLLQPGEEQLRWSTARAARIEGYVVSVANGPLELAHCYCARDIHIHVAGRPDAPPREQVVLEITPRMQDWATRQHFLSLPDREPRPASRAWVEGPGGPTDWSEETLQRKLTGRWCAFEGWLFYDSHHAGEAENTAPGEPNNWRATAWEIHPITRIEVWAEARP
jgi:hypothetical protein